MYITPTINLQSSADAIMITFEKPAAAYVVSAVLSGLSVLSAVFLHQIHREFRLASASDIVSTGSADGTSVLTDPLLRHTERLYHESGKPAPRSAASGPRF